MIDIIYNTYTINNLKFSLKALQDLNYDFNLIIHNDNPEIVLTKEWLLENCELNKIKYNKLTILNEDENVGMLFSRIKSFRAIENSEYTLFMDDDDYLLIRNLPKLDNYCWYRYNTIIVENQKFFEKALQGTFLEQKINFNICASFWKSSILKEAFDYIQLYPFKYKINTLEDRVIQETTHALCLKHGYNYLKHFEIPGIIYTKFLNNFDKYKHINEPRYNLINTNPNYENLIVTYCNNLKEVILSS